MPLGALPQQVEQRIDAYRPFQEAKCCIEVKQGQMKTVEMAHQIGSCEGDKSVSNLDVQIATRV